MCMARASLIGSEPIATFMPATTMLLRGGLTRRVLQSTLRQGMPQLPTTHMDLDLMTTSATVLTTGRAMQMKATKTTSTDLAWNTTAGDDHGGDARLILLRSRLLPEPSFSEHTG